MSYKIISSETHHIVEQTGPITALGHANDLISACVENDTYSLLLTAAVMPADFFVLSTRFAGEFLQKLQNYQLRTAIVIAPDADYGERFSEYLVEAKRARYSRFFTDRNTALEWLRLP